MVLHRRDKETVAHEPYKSFKVELRRKVFARVSEFDDGVCLFLVIVRHFDAVGDILRWASVASFRLRADGCEGLSDCVGYAS